jgi:hypothetical protein
MDVGEAMGRAMAELLKENPAGAKGKTPQLSGTSGKKTLSSRKTQ